MSCSACSISSRRAADARPQCDIHQIAGLVVVRQADHVAQLVLGAHELQKAALADHLPLLVEDELDVLPVESLVVGDGLGEGVLGLR